MKISDIQNNYGVQLVLELIQNSKPFYEEYIKKYPDNTANALSFSKNPNCSCRSKLTKHYNENKSDVDSFVENFLNKTNDAINLKEFVSRHNTKPVSGRVVRIDKTDQAYGELVTQIHRENWVYRTMSVVAEDDKYVFFFV
tara:strand:- start:1863 stop:2285 length:423 start_codon:yes stop_codon:yes gene_type:complete